MNELKNLLIKEKVRLEEIISMTKMRLNNVPKGTLRISQSNSYRQFYHCTDENKLGKYIAKGNEDLVQQLAQKSYDEKVLKLAEKR